MVMIVPAWMHLVQVNYSACQSKHHLCNKFSESEPTVVEDGDDQDHERREVELPDQGDQQEPDLPIFFFAI
jgi:hypothetical protein